MKSEIRNLRKAAQRILKAIKNKEKIILYGDADLDGIASVVILKETIKSLGGIVGNIYFPDREKEGYGINKEALNFLSGSAPALFISLDCGISNFEEVEVAKKMGFEVIIIDHHEILGKLPKASIVIDPKQESDKYPFKQLANAVIAFKLSDLLLTNKNCKNLRKSFLELAALATLSDMMPEVGENKVLIEEGLRCLESTWRPGLKKFFEIDFIKEYKSTRQIAQKIVSAFNAGEAQDHLHESYLLLTSSSQEEAESLALKLLKKATQKKAKIQEISETIKEKILGNPTDNIIFEGNSSWPVILVGPIASRVCAQFQRPTFIFKKYKEESQGAVRMPKGLNGVKFLMGCQEILKTFGGHPQAAGFRIKNENLDKFKKCLIQQFSNI